MERVGISGRSEGACRSTHRAGAAAGVTWTDVLPVTPGRENLSTLGQEGKDIKGCKALQLKY